jgi:hypothetical protein
VPTLTSLGFAGFLERPAGAAATATVLAADFARLAGLAFLVGVFVARRDRTGRSVMVCTSLLASDSPH